MNLSVNLYDEMSEFQLMSDLSDSECLTFLKK